MSSKAIARFAFAVFFSLLISVPALADSHVRIVRLSYIEGGVQIDRNTGQYEKAMVNLPVTEGFKVRTETDGRAEVEFEDGSTLRLASNTTVQFPTLSLRGSGAKVSVGEVESGTLYAVAEVESGTVYVDFGGAKNADLTLQFGQQKVVLRRAAHLRIAATDLNTSLAVFKGDVAVESPSGSIEMKKNQTATFDAVAGTQPLLAKNIEPEPLDSWDKQQSQYHERYGSNSYGNYSPYAYGTSDLSYYGTFFSAPGYGMVWQPYLIGSGWDPFMDGAWAFSPGFGYGWVSAYPWGWTPYHYGGWVFLPGYGWAWQPGGVWSPFNSQPTILRAPTGFKPPRPPVGVVSKGATIVTVNRFPPSLISKAGNKVEIRNNSAGLGVPRGQVSNLARVSHQVEQRGSVTQTVRPVAVVRPAPSSQRSGPTQGPSSSRGGESRPSFPQPRMSSPAPSSGGPRRK